MKIISITAAAMLIGLPANAFDREFTCDLLTSDVCNSAGCGFDLEHRKGMALSRPVGTESSDVSLNSKLRWLKIGARNMVLLDENRLVRQIDTPEGAVAVVNYPVEWTCSENSCWPRGDDFPYNAYLYLSGEDLPNRFLMVDNRYPLGPVVLQGSAQCTGVAQ